MTNEIHPRLLPIQGAHNVRDIGGFKTQDGHHTKDGVFFRSDSTSGFTEADTAYFTDRNLRLVCDLRSAEEVTYQPSVFAAHEGIHYENIQLIDGIHSHFDKNNIPQNMGQLYIQFLENAKPAFAKMFRLFAQNSGASLFHCTAGKDRTGVTAMLLLNLAGVSDADIIDDYKATESFTAHLIEAQKAKLASSGLDVPEFLLHADPENMEETLAHLHSTYQTADNYLRCCGVEDTELQQIVERFVS